MLNREKRIREVWHNRELTSTASASLLFSRVNRLISGCSDVSKFEYVAKKYLQDKRAIAVSLGSGSGEHELSWYQTGAFNQIDGMICHLVA